VSVACSGSKLASGTGAKRSVDVGQGAGRAGRAECRHGRGKIHPRVDLHVAHRRRPQLRVFSELSKPGPLLPEAMVYPWEDEILFDRGFARGSSGCTKVEGNAFDEGMSRQSPPPAEDSRSCGNEVSPSGTGGDTPRRMTPGHDSTSHR